MSNPGSEHALGFSTAPVTLVEYGSFHCPHCEAAHEVVGRLRDRFGDRLRYVFRHRPITGDELARDAAVFAEYADMTTGRYWEAHGALMNRGAGLEPEYLAGLAADLAVPPPEENEATWRAAEARVQADRERAAADGAAVSPTFLVNGRRYGGAWDENALAEAIVGSLGHRLQSAALRFATWAPSTGLLLLLMSLLAVALANSAYGEALEALWHLPVGLAAGDGAWRLPLREWINDGLLTLFFLVVGLEIKREFTVGRLASRRAAALPFAAAAGGMLVPATIYLLTVPAGPWAHGWAIPTTTDTAFAVALVAVLGQRVPVELRIFLTAAVVVDDLVAIALVAIFYAGELHLVWSAAAFGVTLALVGLNRGNIYRPLPYAILGVALWACLHAAGLHATLAGIVVAVVTPTRPPPNVYALMAQARTVIEADSASRPEGAVGHGLSEPAMHAIDVIHERMESPADRLLRSVEPWSSYFVLPLFAFANAGLAFNAGVLEGRGALLAGVAGGLVLGKPLGMLAGSFLAVRLGIAEKPAAYSWRQLAGAGALAGIGFTMSLYIAAKALPDPDDFAAAKLGIFIASILAGILGTALLWRAGRRVPA